MSSETNLFPLYDISPCRL